MNLRKGFRITTWIISLIAFIGFVAVGIYDVIEGDYEYSSTFLGIVIDVVEGDYEYSAFFAIAFASFAGIWLIYWIPLWSVLGFHKIGKKKVLKIIKWAIIIFLASILFHLADCVVHKTIKLFTQKQTSGFLL